MRDCIDGLRFTHVGSLARLRKRHTFSMEPFSSKSCLKNRAVSMLTWQGGRRKTSMCVGASQREDSLPWQQRQWQSWRRAVHHSLSLLVQLYQTSLTADLCCNLGEGRKEGVEDEKEEDRRKRHWGREERRGEERRGEERREGE